MKKIFLLTITSLAMLMADITLEGGQLTPLTEPVAETTPTVTEPTAPTGEYTIVPGLYGFGTDTRAAYGGAVDPVILHVDTLATGISNTDSTHGSFKWAVTRDFPRIIVFDVSGVINETELFDCDNPYMTIAGQTAPGPIIMNGGWLRIQAPNVLIQHFGFRGRNVASADGLSINSEQREVYNVVLDHVSISWGVDENLEIYRVNYPIHDITIANTIMAEGILSHSMGGIVLADNVSLLGNLYHSNNARNAMLNAESSGIMYNNLIYNYGTRTTHLSADGVSGASINISYIGNETLEGPSTNPSYSPAYTLILLESVMSNNEAIIYMEDNIKRNGTPVGGYDVTDQSGAGYTIPTTPIAAPNCTPYAANLTRSTVLENVGSRPNDRDAVDIRFINEVNTLTGSHKSTIPTLPSYKETTSAFVPVANPHDMYNEHYTNLENQLHQLAEAVETSK